MLNVQWTPHASRFTLHYPCAVPTHASPSTTPVRWILDRPWQPAIRPASQPANSQRPAIQAVQPAASNQPASSQSQGPAAESVAHWIILAYVNLFGGAFRLISAYLETDFGSFQFISDYFSMLFCLFCLVFTYFVLEAYFCLFGRRQIVIDLQK